MHNICPNNINNAQSIAFKGLFSKKDDNVFILDYGKRSVLNGEARVAIPENSVINFRDTYKIDLTTPEMKSRIKKLKKNESIVIDRNDMNPDDTTVSRKQFELKKIGKVLYLYNLSQFGTEFQLINPNEQKQISNFPRPVNLVQRQPLTNYNPNYLVSRYGQQSLNFSALIEQKYDDLRLAKYSDASTYSTIILHIQCMIYKLQ